MNKNVQIETSLLNPVVTREYRNLVDQDFLNFLRVAGPSWRMGMAETGFIGWIPEIRNLKLEIGEPI